MYGFFVFGSEARTAEPEIPGQAAGAAVVFLELLYTKNPFDILATNLTGFDKE